MPVFQVHLNGDNAWPDLRERFERDDPMLYHLPASVIGLAALEGGMRSGRPSLALRLDLPDGRTVIAETSLGAWQMATAALRGRFPDEEGWV